MKHIPKKEQPIEFTNWKGQENEDWTPSWNNFQNPEKTIVHKALLREQGYLCCYCGISIDIEKSHIEHLQPRHKYPNLTLEYNNFLASCPGYDEQEIRENENQPKPEHCGHYKDDKRNPYKNEDLKISPLDEDCETYFRYDENGNILPIEEENKKELANLTIKKLGLNSPKLIRLRKNAIAGYLDGLETFTTEEINQLVEGLDKLDDDGKYLEFCFAIQSILSDLTIT